MTELNALSRGMKTLQGISTVSGSKIRFRAWFESAAAGLTAIVVGTPLALIFYRPMLQKDNLVRSLIVLFLVGVFTHLLWEVLGANKWVSKSFKN